MVRDARLRRAPHHEDACWLCPRFRRIKIISARQLTLVITGRQRPASVTSGSTLPDPVIQSKDRQSLHFCMDRRVKPGDDEYWETPGRDGTHIYLILSSAEGAVSKDE